MIAVALWAFVVVGGPVALVRSVRGLVRATR